MRTVLLLIASNAFMTVAWYGHLKFKGVPLWQAIAVSWGIAFFEYCLQVPANRWGSAQFSVTQLKVMQEVITLSVFTAFSLVVFKETPRWNHVVAYALIIGAVGFAFIPAPPKAAVGEPPAAAQQ
jgi:hypothetical protein